MIGEPEVLAAMVLGMFTVFATLIAAISAALIGKRFQNQSQIKSDLRQAISDIEFLLEVERKHCEIHRSVSGDSKAKTVRKEIKASGLAWSGRFTPGRAKSLKTLA